MPDKSPPKTVLLLTTTKADRVAPFKEAIIPVDEYATGIAARACETLGLPHNTPEAAVPARNKYRMREMLSAAGEWCPYFARFDVTIPVEETALEQPYPCVLKPILLSGRRGVIRADSPAEFIAAFCRIGRMSGRASGRPSERDPDHNRIMVESYIPGTEVVLEGLLTGGRLSVLALFDHTDKQEGPYFGETMYVMPSRLPETMQHVVTAAVQRAATAVGLSEGPVHAKFRVHQGRARMIEIAGRPIGGLFYRVMELGLETSPEELVLRHAQGGDLSGTGSETRGFGGAEIDTKAAGVMMLPVREGGLFQGCEGLDAAKKVPGVEDVVVAAGVGDMLSPLPEGGSCPGFILAKGVGPGRVEQILRKAYDRIRLRVKSVRPT